MTDRETYAVAGVALLGALFYTMRPQSVADRAAALAADKSSGAPKGTTPPLGGFTSLFREAFGVSLNPGRLGDPALITQTPPPLSRTTSDTSGSAGTTSAPRTTTTTKAAPVTVIDPTSVKAPGAAPLAVAAPSAPAPALAPVLTLPPTQTIVSTPLPGGGTQVTETYPAPVAGVITIKPVERTIEEPIAPPPPIAIDPTAPVINYPVRPAPTPTPTPAPSPIIVAPLTPIDVPVYGGDSPLAGVPLPIPMPIYVAQPAPPAPPEPAPAPEPTPEAPGIVLDVTPAPTPTPDQLPPIDQTEPPPMNPIDTFFLSETVEHDFTENQMI